MLKKLFSISLALLLVFTLRVVNAQENESAFGELSGKENKITIKNTEVSEYRNTLDRYDSLLTQYEKSFGSTKDQLEEDAINMSKRILALKLGVAKFRIEDFQTEFNKMNFTQEEKQEVGQIVDDFKTYLEQAEDKINEAGSLTVLSNLSGEINTNLSEIFNELEIYTAKFSIEKGLEIIDSLAPYLALIAQHIDVATDAGVVLDETTEAYASALLDLEEAESRYTSLRSTIGEGNLDQDIIDQTRDLNNKVRESFYTVQETVETLMFRYGETPWSLE